MTTVEIEIAQLLRSFYLSVGVITISVNAMITTFSLIKKSSEEVANVGY